jgi:aspartate aminotransferase-like enzyme
VKRDGYVIYGGLGDAARTTFRICTLGAIEPEVLVDFIDSLERALVEAKLAGAAGRQISSGRATGNITSRVTA